ncbi:MAG: L-threonylcarbamoyladenylate synthase [Patescibacteria group bacterium]|nr:L-threonylcarbamoyladenylate synthase [Patescibacteria group bacterium]
MKLNKENINGAVKVLKNGGIAVLPTDTIYGIHCLALDKKAVERVYEVRKRDKNKPCIILISNVKQIEKFGIGLFEKTESFFQKIWPGKVSIILPISRKHQKEFEFLHRGVRSLGFRMPALSGIRKIIEQTGPLISTSANFQGTSPAKNVKEAKEYFGDKADFYLDGGALDATPSSLAKIEHGKLEVLRKGEIDLEKVDF